MSPDGSDLALSASQELIFYCYCAINVVNIFITWYIIHLHKDQGHVYL